MALKRRRKPLSRRLIERKLDKFVDQKESEVKMTLTDGLYSFRREGLMTNRQKRLLNIS